MVTQATAEAPKEIKRRGRPKKDYAVKLAPPAETVKGEKGSSFQRLVKQYSEDTLVKGFNALRSKLFKEGEPLDEMTRQLKKRIADLQAKGAPIH